MPEFFGSGLYPGKRMSRRRKLCVRVGGGGGGGHSVPFNRMTGHDMNEK